jgi:hypothetical protein
VLPKASTGLSTEALMLPVASTRWCQMVPGGTWHDIQGVQRAQHRAAPAAPAVAGWRSSKVLLLQLLQSAQQMLLGNGILFTVAAGVECCVGAFSPRVWCNPL